MYFILNIPPMIMLFVSVLPFKNFTNLYDKSWWPCAKSINFWRRNGWMNKKSTFLSLFLKFCWANLQTPWAKIATYGLRGSTALYVFHLSVNNFVIYPRIIRIPSLQEFHHWLLQTRAQQPGLSTTDRSSKKLTAPKTKMVQLH